MPQGRRVAEAKLVLLSSDVKVRSRTLSLPISIIGVRPTAEVPLKGNSIAPSHTAIIYDGQDFWIRDLVTKGGTFVDGEPVSERDISSGCTVRIGAFRFRFEVGDPHLTRTVWPQRLPECAIVTSGSGEQRILDRVATVIGAREGSDVVLAHPAVADIHALLVRTCRGLWIHDMATRNGTSVNGRRRDQCLLKSGDTIEVGPFSLTVSVLRPGSGADRGAPESLLASSTESDPDDSTVGVQILGGDDEASQDSIHVVDPDDDH